MHISNRILPSTSKRHKQKTRVWHKYTPCEKTTWVPALSMPDAVKKKMKEGVVEPRKLRYVLMSKRVVVGPPRAHEQLKVKTTNRIVNLFFRSLDGPSEDPRPWQITDYNFVNGVDADHDNDGYDGPAAAAADVVEDVKNDSDGDCNPNKRCRIDVVEAEIVGAALGLLADTIVGDEDAEQRNYIVPDLTELKIVKMLESINRTYDNLPNRPEKKDLESAYNHLCQEQYFTGKLHRMYPFDRWKTCRTIRHPLNLMKVRSYVHTHEILYTHTRTRTRANMFT